MDTKSVFSSKAEKYARYRWEYAPRAVEAIFTTAGLSGDSTVADIGAGIGILTRQFTGRIQRVIAVEPNLEMRREAEKRLPLSPSCLMMDGSGERTGLADRSVDLITVAQAIHWMEGEAVQKEFLRILKPGGWLAILRNYPTNQELDQAIDEISIPDNGVDASTAPKPPRKQPPEFFYTGGSFQKLIYPFTYEQGWEEFFGALISASFMPDEGHPLYPNLERAARGVFARFSRGGRLRGEGATELYIGQPDRFKENE
jgi:ubiquinone/menaquinone biosynthesis C-methylase UbiE